MFWHRLFVQVTIQVQEVELGGGAQRQGSFLSMPGGHRVLGKQLSADNAESHRWPHPSCHHVPWWRPNPPNNTNGLFLCLSLSHFYFCCINIHDRRSQQTPSCYLLYFLCLPLHVEFILILFVFYISPMSLDFLQILFWNFDSNIAAHNRDLTCERADFEDTLCYQYRTFM